jgi:hypothetical protein
MEPAARKPVKGSPARRRGNRAGTLAGARADYQAGPHSDFIPFEAPVPSRRFFYSQFYSQSARVMTISARYSMDLSA